jgi:hypothetical protein
MPWTYSAIAAEPAFLVPSALELTPEKFHDYLSMASSPTVLKSGSPEAEVQEDVGHGGNNGTSPPSFAQV